MASEASTTRKPFIEHIYELRRRALIAVLAILAGGLAGYSVHEKLLHIIQKPLGQTLYYTSPTGGFSFIFKLCLLFGLVLALPVIIYEILKFLSPLMKNITWRFTLFCLLSSASLAFAGIAFAYFVSLPAALHFLANFGGQEIQSLITADEYFNFALAYLGGFAVLFQLPLILLLINRVKPLQPGPLMRAQRYVLVLSFIVAAVLTPTPDPINQAIMAVPVILLYQISIVLIWLVNYKKKKTVQFPAIAKVLPVNPQPYHNVAPQPHAITSRSITQPIKTPNRYADIIPASAATRNVSFVARPVVIQERPAMRVPTGRLIDMVKT